MSSDKKVTFRQATVSDIPFLVETIIQAEKSGSDVLSYSTIFELPETEVRQILTAILNEDVQGQELCYSDYLVAEVDGEIAGAVAAWIEGETGQPGNIIKGTLIKYFFPEQSIQKALQKRKIIDEIHFERENGVLAIDIGLTLPKFRGMGILASLMEEQTRLLLNRRPDVKLSQIHVLKSNVVAYKIYCKLGYSVVEEKTSHNPLISQWLPSNTRIIMDKHFN